MLIKITNCSPYSYLESNSTALFGHLVFLKAQRVDLKKTFKRWPVNACFYIRHCCSSCKGKHNKLSWQCLGHPTARCSYNILSSNLVMRHSFLLPAQSSSRMFSKSISLFFELARNKAFKLNAERNFAHTHSET